MARIDEETRRDLRDVTKEILELAREKVEKGEHEIGARQLFVPKKSVKIKSLKSEHRYQINNELLDILKLYTVNEYQSLIFDTSSHIDKKLDTISKKIKSNCSYTIKHTAYSDRFYLPKYVDVEPKNIDSLDDESIYKYDIINFVKRMANAQNSLKFDDQVFNRVFQIFYSEVCHECESSILVPIVNLDGDFESIDLPTNFGFKNIRGRYQLKNVEVIPMTTKHLTAFSNFSYSRSIPRLPIDILDRINYILKIDVFGDPLSGDARELIKSIGRSLRLYKPKSNIVYMGPAFYTMNGLSQNRYDIPEIASASPPELRISPVYTTKTYGLGVTDMYELSQDEAEDIFSFSKRYIDYLNPEQDGEIISTIRRLDEMFSNLYIEDELVNCAIGFEGSLLRDIGNTSSFTFRLKLRSNTLLQTPLTKSENINEFLNSLYYARSEIVHNDRDIIDILENIDFDPPRNDEDRKLSESYSVFARSMLANTILAYLDHQIDFGLGVTEVNQLIDEKALETRLDFEEFE